MNVSIPSYEDLEDESGQSYTIYNVMVEDTVAGIRWMVLRRYSAFSDIFKKLKGEYFQIQNFRFPRKSAFNTHSRFTKERRRKGFEDFLKLVVCLDPLPKEVEDFLELGVHRKKAVSIRQVISPTKMVSRSLGDIDGSTSSASSSMLVNSNSYRRNSNHERISSSAITSNSGIQAKSTSPHVEKSFLDVTSYDVLSAARSAGGESHPDCRPRSDLPSIISLTCCTVLLMYLVGVFYGFVDVSESSYGRIFLTLLSLVTTFSLLRMMLEKRDDPR